MASEAIDRVIERFRTNREKFEAFARSLSDAELARPVPNSTWLVKDFVSHLATLDTQSVRWFEALAKGAKDPSGWQAKRRDSARPTRASLHGGQAGRAGRCEIRAGHTRRGRMATFRWWSLGREPRKGRATRRREPWYSRASR